MSLSKRLRTSILACILVSAGISLSACSFTPVYSGTLATQPTLNFAYAEPGSRLEQIIYQDLALRFGKSDSPSAPMVMTTVTTSNRAVARTATPGPSTSREVTVTANLTIVSRDGSKAPQQRFTRTATATYTASGQVLANQAAQTDASERAAKAVAESLRLAILASLSR